MICGLGVLLLRLLTFLVLIIGRFGFFVGKMATKQTLSENNSKWTLR